MTSFPGKSSSFESDDSDRHPIDSVNSGPSPDKTANGADGGAGAAGSGESIEMLWRQFGEQLRRRARTRLRQYGLSGQAESMDICNDVMADLARRQTRGSLQCDDVLAYVMRAIDHQVLDTFRTLARQCRDFRRVDAKPIEDSPRPAHQTSPSQIAVRREVLAKVRSMLSDDDRLALEMMLENRDWNEIGAALEMRPDTARMRVRRAIQRVRIELGVSGNDDE